MLQTVKTQLQQKIGSSDGDFWIGLYARKWVSTYSGESWVLYLRHIKWVSTYSGESWVLYLRHIKWVSTYSGESGVTMLDLKQRR